MIRLYPQARLNRLILVGTGLLLGLGLLVLAIVLHQDAAVPPPPSFETVQGRYQKSDALLLDRHHQVIHELRVDREGRRLEWVPLREVSPALRQAVVQSEDRRFYRHGGVDWQALAAAVLTTPRSGRTRGASTITMQVSALLDSGLRSSTGRRTWRQKWRQLRAAQALEKTWSKDQILETYLNLIPYRSELQGLAAAARGLFDKRADGLTDGESLILASLIPAPNASRVDVDHRAARLNRTLGGRVPPEELKTLVVESLSPPYRIRPTAALAPHVAHRLLGRGASRTVCTLDGRLQQFAGEALQHQLKRLTEAQVQDGAILILDNASGEVLAYVGNSGESSGAPWVDGVMARRQAGSTLKPFLYALALERKLLTPASLLDDSPLQVPTPTGLYVPQNYDRLFRGPVSLRTALSSSINIPAVRTLLMVGLEPFRERLQDLGFDSLTEDAEFYGPSLSLGSADITLWELTNAYRTLARGGRWSPPRLRQEDPPGKARQVTDHRAAAITAHILADREARRTTFGLENPLSTRFWTAVKTGTSKDMRDNWCLGFSEKITVGVWVGNFSGEPMRQVSGVSGAAPVWLDLMNYFHAQRTSRPPRIPEGVVRARVSFDQDLESPREEWFLPGTEPLTPLRVERHYRQPRIVYPLPETLISLDPEIPEHRQRVPFRYQPFQPGLEWFLDDQRTGGTEAVYLWKPERGRHVLALVDRDGRRLDTVEFLVR